MRTIPSRLPASGAGEKPKDSSGLNSLPEDGVQQVFFSLSAIRSTDSVSCSPLLTFRLGNPCLDHQLSSLPINGGEGLDARLHDLPLGIKFEKVERAVILNKALGDTSLFRTNVHDLEGNGARPYLRLQDESGIEITRSFPKDPFSHRLHHSGDNPLVGNPVNHGLSSKVGEIFIGRDQHVQILRGDEKSLHTLLFDRLPNGTKRLKGPLSILLGRGQNRKNHGFRKREFVESSVLIRAHDRVKNDESTENQQDRAENNAPWQRRRLGRAWR